MSEWRDLKLSKQRLCEQLNYARGKLELIRQPPDQDRHERFSTEIFERYRRSEKALVAALTEIYIQREYRPGRSKRSARSFAGSFSASAISGFNKKLDEELGRFARPKLECEIPT